MKKYKQPKSLDVYFIKCQLFTDMSNNEYIVALSCGDKNIYKLFYSADVKPFIDNTFRPANYKKINGKIIMKNNSYVVVKNNILHCEYGQAICCPGGLDSFIVGKNIESYLLDGKILEQREWINHIKATKHWPQIMATILGSKSI